jgi:hypothetical protein
VNSVQHLIENDILIHCRCKAKPDNLDDPDAQLRTREQTAALLESEEPDSLWYNHGLVPDFQVRQHIFEFSTQFLTLRYSRLQ